MLEKVKQYFEISRKWVIDHINGIDIFDEHYIDKAKTNPWYTLGSLVWLFWMVTIVSGCLLMAIYIPSIAEAYDSIVKIQTQIPFGSIIRGVHKYGTDALIIAATMRLYRMFIACDYKPNREFNIAIALITLLFGMYSGLTGYLLIWNQRAFWATKVFATFPTYVEQFYILGPTHIGANTSQILLGGSSIGQATMTRFYAFHIAFTLLALIAYELYIYKMGHKRLNISWKLACLPIAMVCITAIILPAQIGHRADPSITPLPILSDWYFLALYQFLKYMEPVWATALTVLVPITVIILPYFDLGPETRLFKRPIFLMVTIMGFLEFLIFSFLIIFNVANIYRDPPIWRIGTWILIAIGVMWQYINHKIERPEKLPVAICDFIAYVACPLFVLYWSFPTLLNGWITLKQQLIGVSICMIPTVIAYTWHLFIRKKIVSGEIKVTK
ncbi:MAG: cytochrome b N-terminal domain-containing protein [Candidatus Melainabacteria bacterium]|nr:cytochrome b N-terminal domain-containing protein [Candidatus Melainabacteria bacterium]